MKERRPAETVEIRGGESLAPASRAIFGQFHVLFVMVWLTAHFPCVLLAPYESLAFANVLGLVRGQELTRGMCMRLCKTVPWCLQRTDSPTIYRNQNPLMLK